MTMDRFGVKEVVDATFYNLNTGKPELFLDTLKMSNLTMEAQETVITGGQGNPELVSWDFGKTGTMEMQDALLNPKAFATKTGNDLVTGVTEVYMREASLTAIAGESGKSKVTLKKPAIAGSVIVYLSDDGYDQELEIATVTVTGSELIFDLTDVAIGEDVLVYYRSLTDANAQTIRVSSDKFPGYYRVVGDTLVKNEKTGVDEPFQIVIDKCKMSSAFTLSLEPENPSVFDFNLKIMKASGSTDMVRMTKYTD
jgi:hypothetical protein